MSIDRAEGRQSWFKETTFPKQGVRQLDDRATNDRIADDRTGAGISPARLVFGRLLLWSALFAGLAVNLVEAYCFVAGVLQMLGGSCTAALLGLWFAVPLVPVGPVLCILGAVLAKAEDRLAWGAGLVGTLLSISAVPFWMQMAAIAAVVLGLF